MARTAVWSLAAWAAALLLAAEAGARDAVVESFDGTPIVTHFYPGEGASASRPAPTVMVGPGWSMSGETNQGSTDGGIAENFGLTPIGVFIEAGYNVLTWDPRGFGGSGGTVMIDDPDFEGRDAQALIEFIAGQPEAMIDDPRIKDPRVGMAGGSYGGGIQLVLAGIDRRVDAIVPTIAWHSLPSSLFQDDALKLGWATVLVAAGAQGATLPGLGSPAGPQTGHHHPRFYSTVVEGTSTGRVSGANKAFFADNGPDHLLRRIKAPTLIVQGTVDTLFPLDEAIRNFRALNNNTRATGRRNARRGLPVKMIFFCGGHGVCFTGDAPDGYVEKRTIAWFDRYLRGDRDVRTGPRFAWVADDGATRRSRRFPGLRAGTLRGEGSGTLPIAPGPSGGGGALFATPSPVSVEVEIPGPDEDANALGAPKLNLTYSGNAAPARTFVYAQIVNPRTNQVLGNVTTPIPLTLDGERRVVRRRLEWVAGRAPAGGGYTLQLAPDSTVYDIQRSAGVVDFEEIDIAIPLREMLPPRGLEPRAPAG